MTTTTDSQRRGGFKRGPMTPEQKAVRLAIMRSGKPHRARQWMPKRDHSARAERPAAPSNMAKLGPGYFAALEKELADLQSEHAGMMDHMQDFGGPDIVRQCRIEARMKVITEELNGRHLAALSR